MKSISLANYIPLTQQFNHSPNLEYLKFDVLNKDYDKHRVFCIEIKFKNHSTVYYMIKKKHEIIKDYENRANIRMDLDYYVDDLLKALLLKWITKDFNLGPLL